MPQPGEADRFGATLHAVLAEAGRIRASARHERAKARQAREAAKRTYAAKAHLADKIRDFILTLRPARFRAIAGGSDERSNGPSRFQGSIWIVGAPAEGVSCASCGKAILVGEAVYDVFADGVEMRFDRDCGQRRMEELRARPNVPDANRISR